MLKLIKFFIFVSVIGAAGYFVLGTTFGDKTLYQHLVTISSTKEAEALKDEIGRKFDSATTDISKKAKDLAIEKVKDELESVRAEKAKNAPGADAVSGADKNSLDTLIQKKSDAEPPTADRSALTRLIRQKNRE